MGPLGGGGGILSLEHVERYNIQSKNSMTACLLHLDMTPGIQARVSPLTLCLMLSQNTSHFSQFSNEGSSNSRLATRLPYHTRQEMLLHAKRQSI